MPKRKTTEQAKSDFRQVHGDFYDYSKVIYINSCTKVIIICPVHGEFEQTPNSHLSGQGCPECGIKSQTKSQSEVILGFQKVSPTDRDWETIITLVQEFI